MDNKQPLISICCVTYNQKEYLRDAIEGFLMQKTSFPFEIIIHDDASTDGTTRIVAEFAQKYPELIVPIIQTENQYSKKRGQIFSRFVLPRARGKYIALCEGDDYWTDPYKLQKQVEILLGNDNISACFSDAIIVDEINKRSYKYIKNLHEGIIPLETVIMFGGALYPTASIIFKKDSIDYNIFVSISELYGDDLLIMLLGMSGKIYYLNQVTSIYRRWHGGVFTSIRKNMNELANQKFISIRGYKKLNKLTNKKYKQYFKRKISFESIQSIRYLHGYNRIRLLMDIRLVDVIKIFSKKSKLKLKKISIFF